MKRNCDYIPLSKKPLILVLCQVRISPREQMAKYVPEIQEEFLRHGYPNFNAGKIQQVQFGPDKIETSSQDRWEFSNKEGSTNIILLKDSFVLQTTAYVKFEDFAKELKLASSIILSKTEHDKFGRLLRIGLRYVDLIQPRAGEDFRYYLRPGLHGLSDDIFKPETGRVQLECAGQTDVDGNVGTMVVRIAQNNQGMDLPPDLVGSAPKRAKRVEKNELVTFVDIDHYLEGDFEPQAELIEKNTYLLHDQIIKTFHNYVITEEAVEAWR